MLARRTKLDYGVDLGLTRLAAPDDFDESLQEVNIYKIFTYYYQTNADAAYGYSFTNEIDTLTLPYVGGISYVYGQTIDGEEVTSNQISGGTIFTAGSTNRYIIVFSTANEGDSLGVTAYNGAIWLYIRKGSTLTSCKSTYLKYVHYNDINNITAISDNCFYNCYKLLGSLVIPDSVTAIGNYAFYNCSSLTGTLTLSKNTAYTNILPYSFYKCGFTGQLVIPDNILSIRGSNDIGAFHQCTGFTSLKLSNNLNYIGPYVFYGCSGMSGELILPDSLRQVNGGAFNGTSFTGNLIINKNITHLSGTSLNGSSIGIFNVNTLTSITIPLDSNLSYIGVGAFYNTIRLKGSLSIPDTVSTIGRWAFANCTGLTGTLKLPASTYSTIGTGTFYNCRFSGTLSFPDNITYITGVSGTPSYAPFPGNLFSAIDLNANIYYIGYYAMVSLVNVRNVYARRMTAPSVISNSFGFGPIKPVLHLYVGATGYDVSPWNNTSYFSSIVYDLE